MALDEETAQKTPTIPPRIEARALLASGLSLIRIGLQQIVSALRVLIVGEWPGRARN
jgi:hypothetical protein